MPKRYSIKPFTVGTVTKYKIWDGRLGRMVRNAVFDERTAAESAMESWEKMEPKS